MYFTRLVSFFLFTLFFFILTLTGCVCSGGKSTQNTTTSEEKLTPPPPPPRPAPGIAKASVEFLNCTEEEGFFTCSLRIKEVHGYGPATPPLPTGTELEVRIEKTLFEVNKQNPSQLLEKGSIRKVSLRASPGAFGEKMSIFWRIVQFH